MNNQILIEQLVNAPRERVFKAMHDPQDLMQWHHADNDWKTPYAETDPKVGGKFKIGFQSPDGKNNFDFEGAYTAFVEPERIDYTIADGRPVSILLTDEGGKTKVALTLTIEEENSAEQQRQGWGLMLKHLADYLGN